MVVDCVASKQVLQSFSAAACEFCREVLRRVLRSASALNVTWTYGRACSVVWRARVAQIQFVGFCHVRARCVIALAQFDGERSKNLIVCCSV